MAVPSNSPSKSTTTEQKQKKKLTVTDTNGCPSPAKRTKSPGVRVLHGRIYDSDKGKTCHQCRQKTMDFTAACKNQKQNKPCTMKFCHTCLLNRYGEKAEEVEALGDWNCPRCRGVCNCSLCRKKQGHLPTGALVQKAKATGFSSVSELLHVKGPENFGLIKSVEDVGASPKKADASKKEVVIVSSRKLGKENSFDGNSMHNGNVDNGSLSAGVSPHPDEKKPKKMKQKRVNATSPQPDGKKTKKMKQEHVKATPPQTDEMKTKEMKQEQVKATSPQPDVKKTKKMKQEQAKVTSSIPDEKKTKKMKQEQAQTTSPKPNEKKTKKMKQEQVTHPHLDEKETKKMKRVELKEDVAVLKEASPKKPRISNEINKDVIINAEIDSVLPAEIDSKTRDSKKVPSDPSRNKANEDTDNTTHEVVKVVDSLKIQNGEAHFTNIGGTCKVNHNSLDFQIKNLDAEPLPQGTQLTTISGIDVPVEDVGSALQFLEFCATFGTILDVKKGHYESVLRELLHGRSGRRGKYSTVVQFHIQLLSLIQEESGERSPMLSPSDDKSSWLIALKNCMSESRVMDMLPMDSLNKAGGYYSLDSSARLRILNFLCDEVLGTVKIRSWIDDQSIKFAEMKKEAHGKVHAAKDKEKSLKQKMLDEVAAAITAKSGAPLSISEHDAIVSQIKSEAAQAHAELLESQGMIPKYKKRPDAVRIEPIFMDVNGCAYWRLKSYFDKNEILRQDTGPEYAVGSCEKWFAFDNEQKKVIEKHISFRERRIRTQKVTKTTSSKYSEAPSLIVSTSYKNSEAPPLVASS